ncbi:MAG: S8 family serine peptidase [Actinomycetia bacterium]|nr:S8 family serine peptidase [Actinomycetes bacterium]
MTTRSWPIPVLRRHFASSVVLCVIAIVATSIPVVRATPALAWETGTLVADEVNPNKTKAVTKIGPELARLIADAAENDRIPVIAHMSEKLDLARQATTNRVSHDRRAPVDKEGEVIAALVDHAAVTRSNVDEILRLRMAQGHVFNIEPLWIVNAVAMEATPKVIRELALRPDIASIDFDGPVATLQHHNPAEPNVTTTGAPSYWSLGHSGAGVVVGVIDSGADLYAGSGELADTWRGGTNSWIDYVDASPTPIDPPNTYGVPHGTLVTGLVAGDDRSGTGIGIAPDSSWIAARVFNQQGQASVADVHAAFQWMLDPDGDPLTDDFPTIVNNSWVIAGASCDLEFEPDVQALVAAGILPVFAAGNAGVTSGGASPGNYLDAFAVGAVDANDVLWDDSPFGASNQGPTDCGTAGTTRTFPELVAPGEDIKTVEGLGYYFSRSGTSIAAPHVTGAAALLLSEFPSLTVAELRGALEAGSVDLGAPGPDNSYGAGRIDVMAARQKLLEASIGDLVWSDLDSNGVFDSGEPGLDGIGVELIGPGPDQALGTSDDLILDTTITDLLGQYVFDGLAPGTYRVHVDEATLDPGSVSTTGANPIEVTVATNEVRTDVDFGYAPPPPGSVEGIIWDDGNGDGTKQLAEAPMAAIGVDLIGPGPDEALGTPDDVIVASDFTDGGGLYQLGNIPPGQYLVAVDPSSLPAEANSTTGGDSVSVFIGPGQTIAGLHFGYDLPAPELVYLSLMRGGALNGGALGVADEDIVVWDGTSYSMFFDGSDLGLGGGSLDVDAFQVLGPASIAFSVSTDITIPGLGAVDDSDIILFSGHTGPATSGVLELYFDGSDVGLARPSEDINGLDILDDGTILITTRGLGKVPGVAHTQDEDVLAFAPSSLGENTAGIWSLWFDGSDVGLDTRGEDLDAIDSGGEDLLVSTIGQIGVPGFSGEDHDVVACNDWNIGPATECEWTQYLLGSSIGLAGRDIDGLTIRDEEPTGGPGTGDPLVMSLDRSGTLNGGALTYDRLDVLVWDGRSFAMVFDASDVGITSGDLDAVYVVDDTTLLLSFEYDTTISGLEVDDSDIVMFTGQLGEHTSGTFEIYFDGSDVGLIDSSGDVNALHVEADGSLTLSLRGNQSVPGVGWVQDRDVLQFVPSSLGSDTSGTWTLVLDGSANGLDHGDEDVSALGRNEDELLLSTVRGGDVGFEFDKRDLLECGSLAGPAGPCIWSPWISGYVLGLNGYGIDGFSVAPVPPDDDD